MAIAGTALIVLVVWLLLLAGFIVPIPFIVSGVKRSNRERAEKRNDENTFN